MYVNDTKSKYILKFPYKILRIVLSFYVTLITALIIVSHWLSHLYV